MNDWPIQYIFEIFGERTIRFVLRRHHASSLHWDLRFLICGKLICFCMRRLPSLDPRTRVELIPQSEHQAKFMESERRIPEGMPGAGPTMVEDNGVCGPIRPGSGAAEARFLHALATGVLDLEVKSHYLRGRFRIEGCGERWFLSKLPDAHATAVPIAWTGKSILTGRALHEII